MTTPHDAEGTTPTPLAETVARACLCTDGLCDGCNALLAAVSTLEGERDRASAGWDESAKIAHETAMRHEAVLAENARLTDTIGLAKAVERRATLDEVVALVTSEEEADGPMPDAFWKVFRAAAIGTNRDAATEVIRGTISATKKSILSRIESLRSRMAP